MRFDYIRALDPPDDEEPVAPLEPVLSVQPPLEVDDEDLDQLVSSVRHGADQRSRKNVVVTSKGAAEKWPSFLGVSLSSARLEPARVEPPPATTEASPRGWASAGMVTMALALLATAVFGAFVILR
ncbi:hypothetical protein [Paraliomyxa miuraensis]|uniref:hypothetical protein n=1 Tax=Paraliomyxa miuraensis TaxID=376150 RepID=UPI0022523C3D|nr:hypothetical protein [Paraliomyxa miuraensis]MCX4241558.1 hypothetical protein [Paraliomyxa miuraensis]